MPLPVLVYPLCNPVKLNVRKSQAEPSRHRYFQPVHSPFVFLYQLCRQTKLWPKETSIRLAPAPGGPCSWQCCPSPLELAYTWVWLSPSSPTSPRTTTCELPKGCWKEGEPDHVCEGSEETPVRYCTVQVIVKRLHDTLESSTPGLRLLLFVILPLHFQHCAERLAASNADSSTRKLQRFQPSS